MSLINGLLLIIVMIIIFSLGLSGLIEIQKILKKIKGIEFTHFTSEDVVRHPLVQKIINAYEKY